MSIDPKALEAAQKIIALDEMMGGPTRCAILDAALVARALLAGEGPVPAFDWRPMLERLFALMDDADKALDDDTCEQFRRDEFDPPMDAGYEVSAGAVIKANRVFNQVQALRDALASSPSPAVRDAPGWAEAIEAAANTVEEHYWDSPDVAGRALALARKVRTLHPSVAEPDGEKS